MTSGPRYAVRIKRSAEREMDRLPAAVFQRVATALLALDQEPGPRGCRKLRGSEHYRVRVGAYRVLYTIDDEQRVIEVVAVGHRRDVYR
jgi:mRNA interferase RelE/StbE